MGLRILQIVPTYYPATRYGGPIRSIHGLSVALARRGHQVHVYTTSVDGDADLDVPLDKSVDMDGVAVRYFRVPTLRRLYWSPGLGRRLRQSVADFDVVHLHSVFLWPVWAGARAALRANVPYFISPRGMLGKEVIRRKNRIVKSAWINLIERKSLADAAGVHVTAELEAEEIRNVGLTTPQTFCVPNGISFPEVGDHRLHERYADLKRPYAFFLSRINWKKGIDRLIKAWSMVKDLHLVIAGNDEEDYEREMRELVRRERIESRVTFLGPVSDECKWGLYANATVFVLASYSENFGNVVAEAMAMGCPVVITPEVGLASLVRSTGSGLVVDGEPATFADAINRLNANQDLRDEMSALGKRAVADHLSWSAVAARMENSYRLTISQRAGNG